MSFEIKLPLFEGPFDLLLFFIERDELDIHDIPISKITGDFLSYLYALEQMNIEVASEFILVAATLMRIKAKMLLPRPVYDEEGQEVDPREELIRHLLEYKKYKSVIGELAAMEEDRSMQHERGNLVAELKKLSEASHVETELQDVDLYKLLKVFEKATQKYVGRQQIKPHAVVQYPYTVEGQKAYLKNLLAEKDQVSFISLIEADPVRIAVIFNFLAVLELLQLNEIRIWIEKGFNNFHITHNNGRRSDGN